MTIAEAIMEHVTSLPVSDQTEVLDFVEYLELKKKKKDGANNWSAFSLSQAMRGMESEDSLYSSTDLKEKFA
jgi:hypothetical protein